MSLFPPKTLLCYGPHIYVYGRSAEGQNIMDFELRMMVVSVLDVLGPCPGQSRASFQWQFMTCLKPNYGDFDRGTQYLKMKIYPFQRGGGKVQMYPPTSCCKKVYLVPLCFGEKYGHPLPKWYFCTENTWYFCVFRPIGTPPPKF